MVSTLTAAPDPLLHSLDSSERLFTHDRRPKWGIGLWVKEESTRRTLVFQDGRVRTFKEGYYELLSPVDPDEVDVDEVYEQLAGEHELAMKDKYRQEARKERPPVMSFKEQLAVFRYQFPDTFGGTKWADKRRRPKAGKRPRKAHVGAASELARRELSRDRLEGLMEQGDAAAIHTALTQVLRRTNLVDLKRDVRPLEALDEHAASQVAHALVHLLWGDARYRVRFKRWLEALRGVGIDPSWSLATVPSALVFPGEHVWVKHRAVDLQARSVRPGMSLRQKPNRRGYRKARQLIRKVDKKLRKKNLEPADMLDVSCFMWETLRPKGQSVLDELKS